MKRRAWHLLFRSVFLVPTSFQLADAVRPEAFGAPQSEAVAPARSCTVQRLEDGVRCGVDEVIDSISDAAKCGGFEWCSTPPAFLCPKRCAATVAKNRTCSVAIACPVKVHLHIRATASLQQLDRLDVTASLVNWSLELPLKDQDALQASSAGTVAANVDRLVEAGRGYADNLLNGMMVSLRQFLVAEIESEGDVWWSTLLLGGSGLRSGLAAALAARWPALRAEARDPFELALDHEPWSPSGCNRVLRLRASGGRAWLLDNWKNILVAESFDISSRCSTAYTAHCASEELVRTTRCPLRAQVVKRQSLRRCLFSYCTSKTSSMDGSLDEILELYVPKKTRVATDVSVDHLSRADAGSSSVRSGLHILQAEASSEREVLVTLADPGFTDTLVHEVCSRVRQNAWFSQGFLDRRCRLAMRAVLSSPRRVQTAFPVSGSAKLPVDLSLGPDGFAAETRLDWDLLARVAEGRLLEVLRPVLGWLPLDLRLEELSIHLHMDGHKVLAEAHPTLVGKLSAQELKDVRLP